MEGADVLEAGREAPNPAASAVRPWPGAQPSYDQDRTVENPPRPGVWRFGFGEVLLELREYMDETSSNYEVRERGAELESPRRARCARSCYVAG